MGFRRFPSCVALSSIVAVSVVYTLPSLADAPVINASSINSPQNLEAEHLSRWRERYRKEHLKNTTCNGVRLDPHVIWKGVGTKQQIEALVREAYARLSSVEGLVDWFRCQGFSASIIRGPVGLRLMEGETVINAGYLVRGATRRPLWGRYTLDPWAHTLELKVEANGRIQNVHVGNTYL